MNLASLYSQYKRLILYATAKQLEIKFFYILPYMNGQKYWITSMLIWWALLTNYHKHGSLKCIHPLTVLENEKSEVWGVSELSSLKLRGESVSCLFQFLLSAGILGRYSPLTSVSIFHCLLCVSRISSSVIQGAS